MGPLNLRVVFGTYNGTFGNVNQLGLSLAHLHIWDDILARNLTAAWVFEDDVIFHDNIEELFPLYWDQVPADFEVIYLGHNPTLPQHLVACEEPGSQRFFHEHSVYTTHAMIISYNGALRLSRAMHGLLNMSKRIKRTPHEYELKIDLFFNYVRETFLQPYEYSKWIAFDSTPEHPAQWGGVPWCRTPDLFDAIIFHHYPMDCCETCNVADVRNATKHPVPLVGTGLAYQHWCKHDSMALNRWRI